MSGQTTHNDGTIAWLVVMVAAFLAWLVPFLLGQI